jgi:cell division septation protein DedD
MDIVYNLKKFFNEQQDEAAIPGLGVFFKVTTDEAGNLLSEEKSVIQFVEKTPRSNAFVNFLGYEENLTENEAVDVIERWVSTILSDLKTKKIANIPELGIFEIKKDKVIFKPAANQNFTHTPDEYGLEEFPKTKHVEKKSNKKPTPTEKQPMSKAVLWAIIGAAIVVLIGGGIACYKTMPGFERFVDSRIESFREDFQAGHNDTRKPKPIVISTFVEEVEEIFDVEDFTEEPEQTQEKTSEIKSKSEVVTTQQPAQTAKPAAQSTTSQMPFNVIGGAFSMKGNADNFLAQMKREGFINAEIIFDGQKQLHLVSLKGFRTQNEALIFKEDVRRNKNIDCWIFTR